MGSSEDCDGPPLSPPRDHWGVRTDVIDDVLYQLSVVQAVACGDADVAASRTVSHEHVDADLRRKWLLGAGR
jgi:hypothetical protein